MGRKGESEISASKTFRKRIVLFFLVAYLTPILTFSLIVFFSNFHLNTLTITLRVITSPFLLLLPGTVILWIFELIGVPTPDSFTSGEFSFFTSPVTFIGSLVFWLFLLLLIYFSFRNRSNFKRKIAVFIISFIAVFTSRISLNTFYGTPGASYSPFYLVMISSILLVAIFVSCEMYRRIVYETK